MKIEIYMEDGQPLIVFPQLINYDKTVSVYSQTEQHSSATRGYLRTLKQPETKEEIAAAWRALAWYAALGE